MTFRFTQLTVPFAVLAACFALSVTPLCSAQVESDPLGTPVPEAEKKIQEVIDAAALFGKLDFDGALAKLKEGIAKHPELPPAELIMAQWCATAKQADGVRLYLERAVIASPDDPAPYIFLGEFAVRERRVTEGALLLGKADSLMASFTKSSERKAQMVPRIANGLSAVAAAREDWAEAQRQLEIWLQAEPKSAAAMQRLAQVLFKQGKAAEAWAQLKAAKEANPKMLTPAAILGGLYEQAGDHKNATKWMDYALKSAPKDTTTRLVVAQWALTTAQTKEDLGRAREEATQALQLDPKSLQAKILRGAVALYQKDWNNAEIYFESALSQSPNNFAAKNNLALALCEQTDDIKKRQAFEHARTNAQLNPKNAEAASTYGWVLYQVGNKRDAEKVLRQAASGRIAPDTAYYLARIYADFAKAASDAGQTEQAKPLKDQAKRLVDSTLKTKQLFSKREDAEALQEELAL